MSVVGHILRDTAQHGPLEGAQTPRSNDDGVHLFFFCCFTDEIAGLVTTQDETFTGDLKYKIRILVSEIIRLEHRYLKFKIRILVYEI